MTSVALKIALLKVIQHSIALKQQFTLLQIELRKSNAVLKENFSRAEIIWYLLDSVWYIISVGVFQNHFMTVCRPSWQQLWALWRLKVEYLLY